MKDCLAGELVDLLGLTDILGSLQANSVLQLQSFLDALVLCVFLYVLVLFTTYISARDSSLLVTRTTVFVIFLWNHSLERERWCYFTQRVGEFGNQFDRLPQW